MPWKNFGWPRVAVRRTVGNRAASSFTIASVLAWTFICILANGLNAAKQTRPHAVICGGTIKLEPTGASFKLEPTGASFDIPRQWLDWNAEFHNGIHLSRAQLDGVRVGDGEWDKEYAEIVNLVLPFGACLVHAGDDGWGKNAVSFADVQMRAYVVEPDPKKVTQRFQKYGPSGALRFSKKVSIVCGSFEEWQRVTLSYPLWYKDYGGTANIDVFSRAIGRQTAVLVFMYAEPTPKMRREVTTIVKSFRSAKSGESPGAIR